MRMVRINHEKNIPLDIIWIDSEHKVVDIKSGEPLNESSIIPQGKAKYVLEINKNLADKSGIEIGDPVVFKRLD